MISYQNIEEKFVAPFDLNVAQNTLSTMREGRLKAIDQMNSIKTALASAPVGNSPEAQQYVSDLGDKLMKRINDAKLNGDLYYALDEVMKASGDLSSDKELLARIKYNQDREAWMNEIDKRTDIDDNTKEYIKQSQANAYNYKNNYGTDINGNPVVIGGNKWEAGETPLRKYSLTELITAGIKLTNPDISGYDTMSFLGSDGKFSKEFNANSTAYQTSAGKTEKLTKEKLITGILGVIRSDPAYRASIEQEMRVESYVANRDGKNTYKDRPDLYNADDTPRNIKEYLMGKIDPMATAASYSNITSSNRYGVNKIATTDDDSNKSDVNGRGPLNGDYGWTTPGTETSLSPVLYNATTEALNSQTEFLSMFDAVLNNFAANSGGKYIITD